MATRAAGPSGLKGAAGAAALAGLCLGAWLAAPPAARAEAESLESAVKANFLYKFAPFVAWPPQALGAPGSPFHVCVFGKDPFGRDLDEAVRGQTVDGRPVTVQRLAHVDKAADCQVLFVGASRAQPPAEVLTLMRGAPVLTVTDQKDGVDGGVIHFLLQDGRVRFSIDNATAQADGLVLSGSLLALAVSVREPGG